MSVTTVQDTPTTRRRIFTQPGQVWIVWERLRTLKGGAAWVLCAVEPVRVVPWPEVQA